MIKSFQHAFQGDQSVAVGYEFPDLAPIHLAFGLHTDPSVFRRIWGRIESPLPNQTCLSGWTGFEREAPTILVAVENRKHLLPGHERRIPPLQGLGGLGEFETDVSEML